MDMTIFSIPAQVALGLIAIIGYFVGRRGRKQSELEANQARLELKRAKAVAADMYLRLHYAIDVAKAVGMPKKNTDLAAKGLLNSTRRTSKKSSTRATVRGASPSCAKSAPTIAIGPPAKSARSSNWPTANWEPPAAWPGCSIARG